MSQNTLRKETLFNEPQISTWMTESDYTDSDMAVDAIPAFKRAIELMSEKDLSEKTILDFGCSQGGFLRMLFKEKPFKAGVGVDIALASLEQAKKQLTDEPVEYRHANALNDYSAYFDIVQSLWVIFHFEDLEAHAAQIRSVLKPGGVYYAHSGEHSESKVWPRWKQELEKRTQLKTYTHSPEEIAKAFENQGFEVEIVPWKWEAVAYMDDFKPTVWHPTKEIYEDHYLNRILMFRAVLKD